MRQCIGQLPVNLCFGRENGSRLGVGLTQLLEYLRLGVSVLMVG